jgi:hypothetical protein
MESIIKKVSDDYNIDILNKMKEIIDGKIIEFKSQSEFDEIKKKILHIYESYEKPRHKHINVLNNITEFKFIDDNDDVYFKKFLSYKIFGQCYELKNNGRFEDSSGGRFRMTINGIKINDNGFEIIDIDDDIVEKMFDVPLKLIFDVIYLINICIFDVQMFSDMYNCMGRYYPYDSLRILSSIVEESDDEESDDE